MIYQKKDGQFILTGSCQLALFEAVHQSLAGRTALMTLLPFSLNELSQAGIKLSHKEQILNGTMPRVYAKKLNPTPYYGDYINTYIELDVRSLLNVKNLHKIELFLQLLAGRVGQLVNLSALSADTGADCSLLGIDNVELFFRHPLRSGLFENMVVLEAFKKI